MCTTAHDAGAAYTAIFEIGKALGVSQDIFRSLPEVLEVLRARLGFQRSALMLDDGEGNLEVHCSVGLSRMHLARACYTSAEGVVGKAFSSGQPILIPEEESNGKRPWPNRGEPDMASQTAAFVAVPIKSGSTVLGVLACDHTTDQIRLRNGDSLGLLNTIASCIGHYVESAGVDGPARLETPPRGAEENATDRMVGNSIAMRKLLSEATAAAQTRSCILIQGELGSGKSTMAERIHELSLRASGPFVRINCAMYSESQLSEALFRAGGALERADSGTLFLDEVGDIAPSVQTRILHVLREREYRRLGDDSSVKANFRLICASGRDLGALVAAGKFRPDLYFQINVVSLLLPPLRDRREDIPVLAERIVERHNAENGRRLAIAPSAVETLCQCRWPGNIRELGNCLEHAATIAGGNLIESLPCDTRGCLAQTIERVNTTGEVAPTTPTYLTRWLDPRRRLSGTKPDGHVRGAQAFPVEEAHRMVKREHLVQALEQCGWVQAKAARKLNLTPRQVNYALQKYQIDVKKL